MVCYVIINLVFIICIMGDFIYRNCSLLVVTFNFILTVTFKLTCYLIINYFSAWLLIRGGGLCDRIIAKMNILFTFEVDFRELRCFCSSQVWE